MENKVCSQCGELKSLDHFYKKKNHKNPQSKCKTCFNKYCVERWVNKKITYIKYKGSMCLGCELSYPEEPYVIFDFHHRDPNVKEFDWSKLRLKSDSKIKEELDKCDLLCSNCHRKKHFLVVPPGFEPGIED